jgi:hypothetical protein
MPGFVPVETTYLFGINNGFFPEETVTKMLLAIVAQEEFKQIIGQRINCPIKLTDYKRQEEFTDLTLDMDLRASLELTKRLRDYLPEGLVKEVKAYYAQ